MSQWYLNCCGVTGVQYTYNPGKGKELLFTEFRYFWRQIGGMNGESVIYCESENDLRKLVDHWNSEQPDKWEYWA